jgi:PAS domain S-box-containing protein
VIVSFAGIAAVGPWRWVALPCLAFLTFLAFRQARLAERALAEADENYRELVDLPAQATFIADADGKLLHISKRWQEWTGLNFAAAARKDWIEAIHPDDRQACAEGWAASLRTEGDFDHLYRLRTRRGEYRWFRARAFPQRNAAGAITRWIGAVEDVHEARLAEEQLRHTARLLEMIGSSTESLIWAKDRDSRMLYVNRALEQLAGITLADVLGKTDAEWNPDKEGAAALREADLRVLESGRVEDIEEVFTGADGERRLYRSIKSPLRDGAGTVIGSVGVATDITERLEAAQREMLLARELDHRAKNLLAVVHSVVGLTRADTLPEFKAAVEGRIQALGRAHSMLSASRWEGAGLERVLGEELAPYRAGEDRVKLSGPALMLRPAAAQSLALVFHELATNAAKYGALSVEGGALDVRWAVRQHEALSPMLELVWTEAGGPPVNPEAGSRRSGFGSRLIRSSIERQLGGSIQQDWREGGLTVTMSVALDRSLHDLGGGQGAAPQRQVAA